MRSLFPPIIERSGVTEVEVHNGSLFLVGGFNQWSPTVWASADGADWRDIGTFPTGGAVN